MERVLAAYEKARLWALQNPEDFADCLPSTPSSTILSSRKFWSALPSPIRRFGLNQRQVIIASGDVLKQNNVINSSTDVSATVNNLIDPQSVQAVVNKSLAQK